MEETTNYNYSSLPTNVDQQLRNIADKVNKLYVYCHRWDAVISMGNLLIEAKPLIPCGQIYKWYDAAFVFSRATASNLCIIASGLDRNDFPPSFHIKSIRKVAELAVDLHSYENRKEGIERFKKTYCNKQQSIEKSTKNIVNTVESVKKESFKVQSRLDDSLSNSLNNIVESRLIEYSEQIEKMRDTSTQILNLFGLKNNALIIDDIEKLKEKYCLDLDELLIKRTELLQLRNLSGLGGE